MNVKEYNGWTNYETWLVSLWMNNEEGSYEHGRELAEQCFKTDGESAAISLADCLKEEYWDAAAEQVGSSGFWRDLVGAALCEVDWREIAESLLSQHCEEYNKPEVA